MIGSNTLFVRHLPADLSRSDREELLKLVGAVKVRVMPDFGKMKYTAFAVFKDHEEAKHALSVLHQREVLDQLLVVEFSTQQYDSLIPHVSDLPEFHNASKEAPSKVSEKELLRSDMDEFSRKLHGIAPVLGLEYLPSPLLKYSYPPPSPTIIQNISNALASVPKFYYQVLHLMNKMNLPAPFGPLTPAPPLAPDPILKDSNLLIPFKEDSLVVENMDVTSSEEESEYETDEEDEQFRKIEKIIPEKPMTKSKKKRKVKLSQPMLITAASKKQRTEPSEVFDSQPLNQKKISMKKIDQIVPTTDAPPPIESSGGFGEIEPTKISTEDESAKRDPADEIWDDMNFISMSEIKKKRLSSREMKTLSIFRNYAPGEPSCRLYIKNLAKQVNEKDLHYIFGRFVNRKSEADRNMFFIKLMKEGRMKGQAFIIFPNESQAKEAVRETNGFMLHTKPLVVQFARSAKLKEEKKETKI